MTQFPFTAVAGQSNFKLALILAAINPSIGGVLVSGPRGCAKSTLARGLAGVLPVQKHSITLENTPPSFVNLPLGSSEEMLVGTLDLQQVINDKKVVFRDGLLAKANGGILYVDEVNLLADSQVDLLLDVAASGVNTVERDGISHQHDAKFLLLGTMNPDEGELRPQLQDRFGLAVELISHYSIEERVEIVRRTEAFNHNATAFCQTYAQAQADLTATIQAAQSILHSITCSDDMRISIAQGCFDACVDGLRADIVWYRAATAHAALCQQACVTQENIDAVKELVLSHRRNSSTPPPNNGNTNSQNNNDQDNNEQQPPSNSPSNPYRRPNEQQGNHSQGDGQWGSMAPQTQKTTVFNTAPAELSEPVKKKALATSTENIQAGKQKGTVSAGQRRSSLSSKKPDWFATLVKGLGQWPPKKIRYAQRKDGKAILHLMLLDTSSSTLTGQLFSQAKGVILSVSKAAYIKREQMAIIGFGNDTLENILPRVRAPKQIQAQLDNIQAGGGTPMREALLNAQQYIAKLQKQLPSLSVRTYIITDGRTRKNVDDIKLLGETLVLDIEDSVVKRGRGESIAQSLGAHYMTLSRYMNVLEDEQPLKKSLFDSGISRNFSHKGLET